MYGEFLHSWMYQWTRGVMAGKMLARPNFALELIITARIIFNVGKRHFYSYCSNLFILFFLMPMSSTTELEVLQSRKSNYKNIQNHKVKHAKKLG